MQDISLHITDIVQNSIRADATLISVCITHDTQQKTDTILIKDDGIGMDEDMQKAVVNPFTTTRTTRKVGLGIPLFKASAMRTGGDLTLESVPLQGTSVQTVFYYAHIDCPPMGDLVEMMYLLIVTNPDIDFTFCIQNGNKNYELHTKQVKEVLDNSVPLNNPDVGEWIKQSLKEGVQDTMGGY